MDNSSNLSQVVAESDTEGNLISSYTRCDDIISIEFTDEIWYYVFDGHGSVRMLTDSAGAVTDSYSYDAYGNLLEKRGDTENDYLYVGEQYNANTGLYYLRARYMNPSTGTFATMDSYQGNIYEPASLHKYMYANTNPVMNTDTSGYCSMPELCVGMTALEVLKASIKFITINTLVGGFVGGILGGIDAALGGAGTKEIWKEALMGLGIGLALGAAISTLMCFSVIFPILQVALQVFRVVLFTLGMVGALVSYQEGNTAQAIFRALLSLFSFVMLGKQIKGFELMRLKGNGGTSKTPGFDEWLNKGNTDNKVYFGVKDGEAKYTGIIRQSKAARLNQHNNSGKGFDDLVVQYDGLTRNQARAIEQYFIENGPNQLNKINSIGRNNVYYQDAMNWAIKYFKLKE